MNALVIDPHMDTMDFSSAEAINMLRGNIQMAGVQYKTIAITSADPNEGKSYIAFRLAQSMASLGKKTLFLDCDIRNSSLKKSCRIERETVGLSEYLCRLCTEEELVYPTTHENFDIIFSGKRSPTPSELLAGEAFDELLAALKERYDYVILDTPPVNVVVDATIVAKKADTTVLVVKSCSTERDAAVRMKKQLEMAGVKLLGVVMNLHNVEKTHYGKYGKYGSGKNSHYGKYGKNGKKDYGKYEYGGGKKK